MAPSPERLSGLNRSLDFARYAPAGCKRALVPHWGCAATGRTSVRRVERAIEAIHQRIGIIWLLEECDRARVERARPDPCLGVSGYHDDGNPTAFGAQAGLQLDSAQPGQLHVRDQACGTVHTIRMQKFFRGRKGDPGETVGS